VIGSIALPVCRQGSFYLLPEARKGLDSRQECLEFNQAL
jgi:hypothetical protein